MGFFVSKLQDTVEYFRESPVRVLFLGLNGAGKTAILYRLKLNELITIPPTMGINVEIVSPCEDLTMTVWDVGLNAQARPILKHYCPGQDGFVFVFDSSDLTGLEEAREIFDTILENEQWEDVPLVVLANKQDRVDYETIPAIAEGLKLYELKRHWHIQPCSAATGDGIFEGMRKLGCMIQEYQKRKLR